MHSSVHSPCAQLHSVYAQCVCVHGSVHVLFTSNIRYIYIYIYYFLYLYYFI